VCSLTSPKKDMPLPCYLVSGQQGLPSWTEGPLGC
jgi:hypothetical protein